ncbi:MAG: hypothetical protein WBW00_18310, partial [Pseudolabrys sp.]
VINSLGAIFDSDRHHGRGTAIVESGPDGRNRGGPTSLSCRMTVNQISHNDALWKTAPRRGLGAFAV